MREEVKYVKLQRPYSLLGASNSCWEIYETISGEGDERYSDHIAVVDSETLADLFIASLEAENRKPAVEASDMPAELTAQQWDALEQITDGGDVSDYVLAKDLRAIQRIHPDWLEIGRPLGDYTVQQQLPYFHACLTEAGRQALETYLDDQDGRRFSGKDSVPFWEAVREAEPEGPGLLYAYGCAAQRTENALLAAQRYIAVNVADTDATPDMQAAWAEYQVALNNL